ncbi:MAG TPA: phosphate ABC transporter substrate-binding protein [Anaerolineales bacterium]|nr:phosphate ABC transporter substrate-binding protein [Anaerolineales bacterium]
MHRPLRAHLALLLTALALVGCWGPSANGSQPTLIASTTIENKGSDTMVNLALAWAESYQVSHPDVRISVTGGGSGTGIAALINRTAVIANASRKIKPEEKSEAIANGVDPMELVVARDAIAIIVNTNNTVDHLTIDQLSEIYSGVINNWAEVGGRDGLIVRLSRETNSGTHVYFLEQVIRHGDSQDTTLFAPETLLLPSSEGISAEIRQNPNAIGYDGLGYVTPDLKVVAVARDASGPFELPSAATVESGSYPLSRDLYMYTAGEPAGQTAAYLQWILGPDAQAIVTSLGFVPLQP